MQIQGKEQQVLLYLIEMIKNNHYIAGDKFVSEQWIKKELNVSLVTIRKAFAFLVDSGVIIKSQGKIAVLASDYETRLYRMKTSLSEVRSLTIGLIFPETLEFFPKVIKGIEQEALLYNCKLNFALNMTYDLETIALDNFFASKVDGIIISPVRHFKVKNYVRLRASGIPFVMIGNPPAQIIGDSVYSNDVFSSYDATNVLLERGCVSVVEVTYTRLDKYTSTERYRGFESALAEYGLDAKQFLFDFDQEGEDRRFVEFLLQSRGKIGVLLTDDLSASTVYSLIKKAGKKIGDSVLVIGYNNTRICDKLEVPLTAINLHWGEIGRQAMKLLYQQISDDGNIQRGDYATHLIVNHDIVFRSSCKQ